MTGGIRAEVKVETAGACPVADATTDRRNAISDVSRNLSSGDGTVVEEFTTDASASVDDDRMYPVFTYDSRVTYRFDREEDLDCPCHHVERHDVPVAETTIDNGSMIMAFHVTDLEELETVIDDLRDRYTISIERLVQAGGEGAGESDDLVFVDRGALTDRQLEVLKTAHDMGYFEYSKASNAGEVAAELDISTSTFSEHLAAAQRKLFGAIVDE